MTTRPCERGNCAAPEAGAADHPALLSPGPEACFIVDAHKSTLESANAAAHRLLALSVDTPFPVALDSAMPAIARLRQIAASGSAAEAARLALWCNGRMVPVDATVRRVTASDGRALLQVTVVTTTTEQPTNRAADATSRTDIGVTADVSAGHDALPVPTAMTSSATVTVDNREAGGAVAADPGPVAPIKRSDTETLREIARRIREGHMSRPREDLSGESAGMAHDPVIDSAQRAGRGTPQPSRANAPAPDPRTLSKVAHELKTPLSAIVAAAEIMRDERLGQMGNDRYLGYASDIHDSARHALDVINVMLSGTEAEARRIEAIDLNELAAASVSAMQPLAQSRAITLAIDCEDSHLTVQGDATALRQIVFNLVSNALKFTPPGGDVRVVTGYLADGTAFLVVRDTGDGMNEEDIARAFYSDDGQTQQRPGGGYGLGLPMVRQLAELMGAVIDVDSAPGRGTVVLIAFPLREAT